MSKFFAHGLAIAALASVAFAPDSEGAASGAAPAAVDAGAVGNLASTTDSMVVVEDAEKIDAIGKVLPSVKLYPDYKSAIEAVTAAALKTEQFYGLPVVVKGYDSATEKVDESIYTGMQVRVGTLSQRKEQPNGKGKNVLRAITILPLPTMDMVMAAEGGKEYIDRILSRDFGLVAYRSIRNATSEADLLAGIAQAPTTVQDFLTESKRDGLAGDTETFDSLWKDVLKGLKATLPGLADLLPNKVETIKAIRSKAYAESQPTLAPIENLPNNGGSAFVRLANVVIGVAKKNGLDSTAIESWVANRETTVLTKQGEREKDFTKLANLDFAGFGAATESEGTEGTQTEAQA